MKTLIDLGMTDVSIMASPGVYALVFNGEVMWVGKSSRLAGRVGDHFQAKVFPIDQVFVLPCDPADLVTLENFLIVKLKPRYNIQSLGDIKFHNQMRPLVGKYSIFEKRRLDYIIRSLGIHDDELTEEAE
jgi:hypothetical protein